MAPRLPPTTKRYDAMSDQTIAIIRRNKDTAAEVSRILGLPDLRWNGLRVEFGHDAVAVATVSIILTPDQLVALCTLAGQHPQQEKVPEHGTPQG